MPDQPRPACALDHTRPGNHLDTCTGTDATGKDCRGCTPALADQHSLVCRWHAGRHRRALGDLPDLVAHLHDNIEPSSSASDGDYVTRGELAPPAPLSVDALSAADDLVLLARSWAARLAGDRRLVGPTRFSTGDRRADQHEDARTLCAWLLTHEDAALSAPWTAAYLRELLHDVGAVTARWPIEQRPVWLPVPCPECGATSLARWAPRWAGAPTTIACERPECLHTVSEDTYPWLVRLAADLAVPR